MKKRGKGLGYRTPDWFKGKTQLRSAKIDKMFEPKGQAPALPAGRLEARIIKKK